MRILGKISLAVLLVCGLFTFNHYFEMISNYKSQMNNLVISSYLVLSMASIATMILMVRGLFSDYYSKWFAFINILLMGLGFCLFFNGVQSTNGYVPEINLNTKILATIWTILGMFVYNIYSIIRIVYREEEKTLKIL